MRVVVLGAAGLLGRALCRQSPATYEVVGLTRADIDIRDTEALALRIRDTRPDWVMNATAYTDVDGAESDRETAFAVNATAVGELARVCASQDAGLMHFSTDYVFRGDRTECYREDDPVSPVNGYGASKEAGEQLVRESGARYLIVRTQWVFGTGGRSFLSTLLSRAKQRQAIRVVSDELGQCTYAADLAAIAWEIVGQVEGTIHVANRGVVSRYDVARRVYQAAGLAELVTPVESKGVAVVARRPSSSVLCLDRIERAIGRPMPTWTDAVDRFLQSANATS